MTIPVIHCTRSQVRAHKDIEPNDIAETVGPAVFVIRESDCIYLREASPTRFESLEKQNPARELKKYVDVKSDKIRVLPSKYEQPGRLFGSIARLLKSPREKQFVLVLAVDGKMWEQLSAEEAAAKPLTTNTGTAYLREFGYDRDEASLAGEFWGDTDEIREVRQKVLLAAEQRTPVLITGPTGCGKTRIARLIHLRSPRKDGPFIPVNCGAFPSDLLESELFGVEKDGGLPNRERKIGQWELADGGTLFLDEVGDMELKQQVKILHALDNRRFRRVLGREEIDSDARIIAATNRPLPDMLEAKTFRDDLYSRLSAFSIQMPPLDSHPEDIPRLALKIWCEVAKNWPALSEEALEYLASINWPDNVRGLQNVLRKAAGYLWKKKIPPTAGQLACIVEETYRTHRLDSAAAAVDGSANNGPQSDFLRHLRRLDHILGNIADALLPLGQPQDRRASEVTTMRRTVAEARKELDDLLRESLLFFDDRLADRAGDLAGALGEISSLLPATAKRKGGEVVPVEGARRRYTDKLVGLMREVRSLSFDTLHEVLAVESVPRPKSSKSQARGRGRG
jgi:DNA-binding NtrC family response regulator